MMFDTSANGSLELQLNVLRHIMRDNPKRTMIDLCCGEMATTRHLVFQSSIHVDVIDEPKRPRGVVFVKSDVRSNHPVFSGKYDVAICADGIEHLTKLDGLRLADRMVVMAALAIIFTPLGEYAVELESDHPHAHKSGWRSGDLPGWSELAFPNWHPTLGIGAIFFWRERTQ